MKQKKTSEDYYDMCNDLASELFDYTLANGGTEIPMAYLLETFTMLAAKVGSDMCHDAGLEPEAVIETANEMYRIHFEGFQTENLNNLDVN